jgi:hypothetical protein
LEAVAAVMVFLSFYIGAYDNAAGADVSKVVADAGPAPKKH